MTSNAVKQLIRLDDDVDKLTQQEKELNRVIKTYLEKWRDHCDKDPQRRHIVPSVQAQIDRCDERYYKM